MKISCYVINLTYITWTLVQWTPNYFVITAAVYIKMICIIENLHYRRNPETQFHLKFYLKQKCFILEISKFLYFLKSTSFKICDTADTDIAA